MGLYHLPGWDRDYPRLQILTVVDLLSGAEVKMLPAAITFKLRSVVTQQEDLDLVDR